MYFFIHSFFFAIIMKLKRFFHFYFPFFQTFSFVKIVTLWLLQNIFFLLFSRKSNTLVKHWIYGRVVGSDHLEFFSLENFFMLCHESHLKRLRNSDKLFLYAKITLEISCSKLFNFFLLLFLNFYPRKIKIAWAENLSDDFRVSLLKKDEIIFNLFFSLSMKAFPVSTDCVNEFWKCLLDFILTPFDQRAWSFLTFSLWNFAIFFYWNRNKNFLQRSRTHFFFILFHFFEIFSFSSFHSPLEKIALRNVKKIFHDFAILN